MATESTLEDNDPEVDNREEYALPPVAEPKPEGVEFDENGVEVVPDVNPVAS